MSQLIKHFLVDRDTGEWIKGKIRGYIFPNLKGKKFGKLFIV